MKPFLLAFVAILFFSCGVHVKNTPLDVHVTNDPLKVDVQNPLNVNFPQSLDVNTNGRQLIPYYFAKTKQSSIVDITDDNYTRYISYWRTISETPMDAVILTISYPNAGDFKFKLSEIQGVPIVIPKGAKATLEKHNVTIFREVYFSGYKYKE